jgi:hypothetical protein
LSNPYDAAGTLTDWEISQTVDPIQFTPSSLPDLSQFEWQRVSAEAGAFILVNRYRNGPNGDLSMDPKTRQMLADSVMTGKIPESGIVCARTTINAERDEVRRLRYVYSDGIVTDVNGQPLAFAMNPEAAGEPGSWRRRGTPCSFD